MGSLLRYCRAVSLRALLVSALLALAWLVWGAGSAHASTDPSKAAVSETALDLGLSDAPSLQTAQVLPAGQDPAGSAVFSAAKTATPVVSTITKTAAPVVATVDHTAAAVDDAVASVTKPLPLPTVKLPQLRNPNLPVATVPKTLPTVKSPVPATFGPDNAQPAAKSPSAAVPPSRAAAVTPSAEASSFAPTSTLSGTASPVPGASNLAATQNTDSPFKTLAQLRMTASPRPLVSAIKAPARGLWNDHAAPERLNIAATHGKSGSSSGSDSSGSHTAADIAETWNGLSPAAGMLAAGVSVTPPSGPAADPGSSPD